MESSTGIQDQDPVVIVGFSFRFPQDAVDERCFWDIIENGLNTMEKMPKTRYNIDGHFSKFPNRDHTVAADGGHYIKGDISAFDAPFFKMSTAEAKSMDPQMRLLLETTYHAFENSGITLDAVMGSNTSVYVGNIVQEYGTLFAYDNEMHSPYLATGVSSTMLSNRLSWFYDLHGPSVSIDTACSSGLVGLHLGCESLLRGDSDMSIIGGVQLQLEPMTMAAPLSRQGFLSPDSQCYSFDARANGYSRGEGVAVIVLKRLSKAVQDGDTIRAVIRGTAVNQDGRTASISQPSAKAQASLIRRAYDSISLDMGATSYFEAHGTGTAVGDPIESEAISLAFAERRSRESPLQVGSVKANIGHLEPSAGLAGLIKVVMMLEKARIPPNALLQNLNPKILDKDWNLGFPKSSGPWPKEGLMRASVNSFGYGGTNAHCVVDDAMHFLQQVGIEARHNTISDKSQLQKEPVKLSSKDELPLLFLLSASDEAGVHRQATSLAAHLKAGENRFTPEYLQDLAFTLSERRTRLPWKSTFKASSLLQLQQVLSEQDQKPVRATEGPSIRYLFTGQGAQWLSMGRDLLLYDKYRESLEDADRLFHSLGSKWSIMKTLYRSTDEEAIENPMVAQPLCTAFQIALIDLFKSWGIMPKSVLGHSSGEIAAAYCAKALSKESALRVAYYRGVAVSRIIEQLNLEKGGMLAVGLSEAALVPYVTSVLGEMDPSLLSCGCINSPSSTTVTGNAQLLDALAAVLRENNVFTRRLSIPVAYHSPYMLSAADYYLEALQKCNLKPKQVQSPEKERIEFYSSVSGTLLSLDELHKPEYWVRNLVSQVKFSAPLQLMCESIRDQGSAKHSSLHYLVEIGPHRSLERPTHETIAEFPNFKYDACMSRLGETASDLAARLACSAYPINIQHINQGSRQAKMLLDLPRYAFDHSQSYWMESRLFQTMRARNKPRHDLLGTPSNDWNPMKPRWRLIIRQSDLPWVSDHKVDDTVLYPAAGMIVMVLEGMRSITPDGFAIAGYKLRDVLISNALVVPSDDEGVEVQLSMHLHDSAASKDIPVYDFWIHSVLADQWQLHCTGQVTFERTRISELVLPCCSEETGTSQPLIDIEKEGIYDEVYQKGFQFGEKFRTLSDIQFDAQSRQVIARLRPGDWPRLANEGQMSSHLIHPATLDGLTHMLFACSYGNWGEVPLMVPTGISEAHISCELLNSMAGQDMRVQGKITSQGINTMDGNVMTTSTLSGKPLITFKGLRIQALQTAYRSKMHKSPPTTLYHQIDWKPDISLLSRLEIEEHCRVHTRDTPGGSAVEAELISRHFLSNTLGCLKASDIDSEKPHLQKYIQWGEEFLKDVSTVSPRLVEMQKNIGDGWSNFINESSKSNQIRHIVSFGQQLKSILRGDVDALEVLFNQGLADAIYNSPLISLTAQRLASYMDLLAHKDSSIRVLEVGAGTGATTTPVLEALSRDGRFTRVSQYDFTDISSAFFADAKERYSAHSGIMTFRQLDIERDPGDQGFELGSYDVVIAAAVLHATSNIDTSLRNVRKLLKPGGQLVFWEPTNRSTATIPFVFGVLPGWWLGSESYRETSPILTKSQWNEALLRAGFDGVQVAVSDGPEEMHSLSLLVSHYREEEAVHINGNTENTTLIVFETPEQEVVALQLQQVLSNYVQSASEAIHISNLEPKRGRAHRCVSLLELDNPIMSNLTESQLSIVQAVMDSASTLIWVSSTPDDRTERPETSMIAGLGKTVVCERPRFSLVHFRIRTRDKLVNNLVRFLLQRQGLSVQNLESDILEEDGKFYVPRVVESPLLNQLADKEANGYSLESYAVTEVNRKAGQLMELKFQSGRLESFHFAAASPSTTPLEANELRVSVKAAGINFKDVMVALNQVDDEVIGQEFAGVIIETGQGLKTDFQTGDRVCGIARGTFCDVATTNKSRIMRMPPNMSFTEAAAIPFAFATAHYGLSHLARVQPGETVLVHAAAGAVGQAAIQIIQAAGACIYVTVGSEEKKKLVTETYGINTDHIFSSRDLGFANKIMQFTGGKGVDVVLNSLSGQALIEGWRCLAPFGRFIEIGKRDMSAFKQLPMEPFLRNVSFASVDLAMVWKHNSPLMEQILREVQSLVLDSTTRKYHAPRPITVYKRSGIEDAFRLMQTGRHTGKIVVDWDQDDVVQFIPRSPLDYRLDGNSTYVVAGGLGGIGRNISMWLAAQGARSLMLPSRSGRKSNVARDVIKSLEAMGAVVYTPQCDIADREQVEAAVSYAKANMAPIKGFIHAAMVVDNRRFENYDIESFQSALTPKVQGTINMHSCLPKGMDFFVLLSSMTGIHGAASQGNYAAANAFQDAFARYRRAQGESAISLALAIVEGLGYIAERADVARNMAMTYVNHKVVREQDLHFLLKLACSPGRPLDALNNTQIIAGLTTPAYASRDGMANEHSWMRPPMFRHLYRMELHQPETDTAPLAKDSPAELLSMARDIEEATAVVTRLLATRLARSLAISIEDVDVDRPPHAFGVDSLVAVELMYWFSTELGADIPLVQILSSSTVAQLSRLAAERAVSTK